MLSAFTDASNKVHLEHLILYLQSATVMQDAVASALKIISGENAAQGSSASEVSRVFELATLPVPEVAGLNRQAIVHRAFSGDVEPEASNEAAAAEPDAAAAAAAAEGEGEGEGEGENKRVEAAAEPAVVEVPPIDESIRLSFEKMMETDTGRALISRCHGLELVDPFKALDKISMPPQPPAPEPEDAAEGGEAADAAE